MSGEVVPSPAAPPIGDKHPERRWRTFARSSRTLLRLARARYAADTLTWQYRNEFVPLWQVVDAIPGWFTEISAAVLFSIMKPDPPETVVEIGSYLGRSTIFFGLCMKHLNPRGRVVAVDPHTGDRQHLEGLSVDTLPSFDLFQQHCRAARVEDVITPIVSTSVMAAERWSDPIDLLYIDGWHSYDAVMADGRAWLPHLSKGGVAVFDDYHAYEEVHEAVDQLAADGVFHLWGSVFGQAIGGRCDTPVAGAHRPLQLSAGPYGTWARWRRSVRKGVAGA